MALLSGTSAAVIAENVRVLKQQGMSEVEAVARARAYASGGSNPESESSDDAEHQEDSASDDPDRSWIIYTKDFSGLGWAKKLIEEGESVVIAADCPEDDPKDQKLYKQVGQGWVEVISLDQAKARQTPTTYNLFAENNFPDVADALRKKGAKVFGTSALTDRLEHDRAFAVDLVESYGLASPPTHPFTTREEGLAFLDENPDTAYVFKPDDGKFNYLTFVPVRVEGKDANRETYLYLDHMKDDPGPYILQERVDGVELNVEAWIYEGEPVFAFVTLEAKRKNDHDHGEMCGCAGDFAWTCPITSPLVKDTIGRLFPYYAEEKYTGFADVNVIYGPGGPQFLEVCNRFGYNSHVTLFLALATDSFSNIMADFVDGHTEDLYSRFRSEIGTSITVFLDHPRPGLPVHLDDRWREQFYPFDGYEEDGTFLLAGYSNEVGIFTDVGQTIDAAAASCLDKLRREAVSFPDMYFRTDLGERGYHNSPMTRYDALNEQWGHSMRMVGGDPDRGHRS